FTALIQETVDPSLLGRVFSMFFSISLLPSLFGLLGTGFLADTIGISRTFVILGCAIGLVGLISFFVPSIRRFGRVSVDGLESAYLSTNPLFFDRRGLAGISRGSCILFSLQQVVYFLLDLRAVLVGQDNVLEFLDFHSFVHDHLGHFLLQLLLNSHNVLRRRFHFLQFFLGSTGVG